jgi:hypothetical protein
LLKKAKSTQAADKRGLKRIGLSKFIGVDRRLKMVSLTFSAAS